MTGWTWDSPSVLYAAATITVLLILWALVSESWQAHKREQGRRWS